MMQFNRPPTFEHTMAADTLFAQTFELQGRFTDSFNELNPEYTPLEATEFSQGVQIAHHRQIDAQREVVKRGKLRRLPSLAGFDIDEVARHGYISNNLLEVTLWLCAGQDADKRPVIARGLHIVAPVAEDAALNELSLLQINRLGVNSASNMELASSTAEDMQEVIKTSSFIDAIIGANRRKSLTRRGPVSHLKLIT